MKNQLICILALVFMSVSCDTGDDTTQDNTNIKIILDFSEITIPLNNMHLYAFETSSDKLVAHNYFSKVSALNTLTLSNIIGEHVFVAVLNVGEDFTPLVSSLKKMITTKVPNITLSDFLIWLKNSEEQYPDMLTGMTTNITSENAENIIDMKINDGTINIKSPVLRLDLSFPDNTFPDFVTRSEKQDVDYNLRVVVEVYNKGTDDRILSYSEILNNNTLDINLQSGMYDILLWVDYTPNGSKLDNYYTTTSLKKVIFNNDIDYTASTDSRDAFSLLFSVTVEDDSDVISKSIKLERPLAKYQIVATDMAQYQKFIELNNYSPIEELTATISYEGYLPNSFNVKTGKPNDAIEGIKFSTQLNSVTENSVTLGSDYIFVNGSESSVTATITITDSDNKVITNITNIKIEYRRGYMTTVTGYFLTAGVVSVGGGIDVDTNWEGDFDKYF